MFHEDCTKKHFRQTSLPQGFMTLSCISNVLPEIAHVGICYHYPELTWWIAERFCSHGAGEWGYWMMIMKYDYELCPICSWFVKIMFYIRDLMVLPFFLHQLLLNPFSTRPHQNAFWYHNCWLAFLKNAELCTKRTRKKFCKKMSPHLSQLKCCNGSWELF